MAAIGAFALKNWRLILIGALVASSIFTRWQFINIRADFAQYKADAIAAAQAKQKAYDGFTRGANLIVIEGAPVIFTETKTLTRWIERNVENVANCPSPDLIRVFNASVTGGLPETKSP